MSCVLQELREELRGRQAQQASLQALWSQLQPEDDAEESDEAREKLHVTGSKLKLLLREVDQDLSILQQRLVESNSFISTVWKLKIWFVPDQNVGKDLRFLFCLQFRMVSLPLESHLRRWSIQRKDPLLKGV